MPSRSGHLVRRFVTSLRPGGPPTREVAWVTTVLSAAELALWQRLSGPDRRHSAQVARRVERSLGHEATDVALAAALLHDVGKVEARLRTYGRVVATLCAAYAGREAGVTWRRGRGFVRRVGLYLDHPAVGGDLLAMAGADPVVVAWAREHHQPAETWSVPMAIASALKDADDD